MFVPESPTFRTRRRTFSPTLEEVHLGFLTPTAFTLSLKGVERDAYGKAKNIISTPALAAVIVIIVVVEGIASVTLASESI